MIQFIQIEGKGNADITFYDIQFDRQYTFEELIDEIIKKDEWGFIRTETWHIQYAGNKVGFVPIWMRSCRIKKASAKGGWGNMDYIVDLLPIQIEKEKRLSIWRKFIRMITRFWR